jgi:membrane-bound lytic murein transglycosylase B
MNTSLQRPARRTRAAGLALALATMLATALAAPAQAALRKHHAKAAVRGLKAPAEPPYGSSAEVLAFADEVAARRQLPRAWIAMQLAQARRVEAVRKLVMPPPAGTAKNWAAYRARFIEPQRIQAGLVFWRGNQKWLQAAEDRWGVPPEIVVAIVGVETFYGRVTGSFRTLDALATLSFDFPPGRSDRSAYFRSELEEFFVLCAREGQDPQSVKGSFAGALGLPQFMPGSLNRYAVDGDGDGHIDLLNSSADVVGSVAHFLASFGWERGLATHFAVSAPADAADRAALLAPDILPSFSAAQFAERGALLDEAGRAHGGPLALVELQNGDRPASFVAGTQNFYTVTRYNHSSYYAMAVIDLARALARQRAETVR